MDDHLEDIESALERLQVNAWLARHDGSRLAHLMRCAAEASTWTSRRFDLSNLATSLRPPHLHDPLPRSRHDALDRVVLMRRQDLREHPPVSPGPGRLLVYFPDANSLTGVAEIASHGFLDHADAPPSGTWIGYFEDDTMPPELRCQLLAWVPLGVVPWVGEAIESNADTCLAWYATASIRLRQVVPPDLLGERAPPRGPRP